MKAYTCKKYMNLEKTLDITQGATFIFGLGGIENEPKN